MCSTSVDAEARGFPRVVENFWTVCGMQIISEAGVCQIHISDVLCVCRNVVLRGATFLCSAVHAVLRIISFVSCSLLAMESSGVLNV